MTAHDTIVYSYGNPGEEGCEHYTLGVYTTKEYAERIAEEAASKWNAKIEIQERELDIGVEEG